MSRPSTPVEFLQQRIGEDRERAVSDRIYSCGPPSAVDAQRRMDLADFHLYALGFFAALPILVEGPVKFTFSDGSSGPDLARYATESESRFVSPEQYRAEFGKEPPVPPGIRRMLNLYKGHPDLDPTWLTPNGE